MKTFSHDIIYEAFHEALQGPQVFDIISYDLASFIINKSLLWLHLIAQRYIRKITFNQFSWMSQKSVTFAVGAILRLSTSSARWTLRLYFYIYWLRAFDGWQSITCLIVCLLARLHLISELCTRRRHQTVRRVCLHNHINQHSHGQSFAASNFRLMAFPKRWKLNFVFIFNDYGICVNDHGLLGRFKKIPVGLMHY